jgi:hypothetical protein
MTQDQLTAILDSISAKTDKAGSSTLSDGRTLTLYAAHDGVQLTVSRAESITVKGGLVRARTAKGELYLLVLEDLFAVSAEGTPAQTRKPGFA